MPFGGKQSAAPSNQNQASSPCGSQAAMKNAIIKFTIWCVGSYTIYE